VLAVIKVALFPLDAASHLGSMICAGRALANAGGIEHIRAFGPAHLARSFATAGISYACTRQVKHAPALDDLRWKSYVRPLSDMDCAINAAAEFAPDVILYDCFSVYGPVVAHALRRPASAFVTMAGYGALPTGFAEANNWERDDILRADETYLANFGLSLRDQGCLPSLFPSKVANLVNAIEPMSQFAHQSSSQSIRTLLKPFAPEESIGRCLPLPEDGNQIVESYWGGPVADQALKTIEIATGAKRQGRMVVLFSIGTVLTDFRFTTPVGGAVSGEAFLCKMLENLQSVAQEMPDAVFIAATGHRFDPQKLSEAKPKNLFLFPSIPQFRLLQCGVDAFITHHGAASQAEAMLCGVPMVSVPGAGDQFSNARLAIAANAAIADWDLFDCFATCTPKGIQACLRRIMLDTVFANASRRIGEMMKASDTGKLLANQLARIVDQSTGAVHDFYRRA
jgi:hypothetical protein